MVGEPLVAAVALVDLEPARRFLLRQEPNTPSRLALAVVEQIPERLPDQTAVIRYSAPLPAQVAALVVDCPLEMQRLLAIAAVLVAVEMVLQAAQVAQETLLALLHRKAITAAMDHLLNQMLEVGAVAVPLL